MKIIYCFPSLYQAGGMERVLTAKANWLASHGYEIFIITTGQKKNDSFYPLNPNIRILDLRINYDNCPAQFPIRILLTFIKKRIHKQKLKKILLEMKADIVISMFTHEMTFLPEIHDGSRKILEYHFSLEMDKIKSAKLSLPLRILYRLNQICKNRMIPRYTQFVLLTERDAEAWGKRQNTIVIPNPITIKIPNYYPKREKTILAVGRLCYQKGFDLLLKSWAQIAKKHPDWNLLIIGTGADEFYLKKLAKDLLIDNQVCFEEPRKNITEKYLTSSVFVMSSRYEGFSLVLAEAQACCLPAVSFDCPCGPGDIIEHGKSGFLIPVGNIIAFAQAMEKLIEDSALRNSFGQYAQLFVKRHFGEDIIMDYWCKLFMKI